MAHTYHSGKNAKAWVGTATATVAGDLDLISWSVAPRVTVVDFKTSQTGNFSEKETTFLDCDFTIVTEQNFSASAFGTGAAGGLSIIGGGTIAAKLFLSGTSGAYWGFPQAVLVGNPQQVAIEGKFGTQFNFQNSGAWTEPTTSP